MPDTFTLTLNSENEAFADMPANEIARILRTLAGRLEVNGLDANGDHGKLTDVNGNSVGGWRYYDHEA